MTDDIEFTPATPADLPATAAFLTANELPTDGLAEHLKSLWLARRDGRIVGSIALELYGDGALLRSAAVDAGLRGQSLGRRLVDRALDAARDAGAPAVYLLTTTAENYFPKFGFERITRADVPPSVQRSVEFQSVCPSSAVVMRRRLTA